MKQLVKNGIEYDLAQKDLIFYMKHKKSDVLDKLGVFKTRAE
jgi:hypothetical protein